MSFADLFWLFFVFSALQPVLRLRMMEAMRTRKIAQLEQQRKSRVILLVHRQETMRLLGFPLMRYIDINDSEQVLRAIQLTDEDVPLDICFAHSGSPRACGTSNRSRNPRAQGQGNGFCPALCN